MINISNTKHELESFLDSLLGKDYFGCIYGSYATGTNNEKSDVDLFISSSNIDQSKFELIKEFIIDYHQKNKLSLDDEVPYENKLFVDYKDILDAVELKGFVLEKGLISVPEVQKNKEFLSSRPIRLRLIFNALTTPHIFFGKDERTYHKNRRKAETNLRFLSTHLSTGHTTSDPLNILLNGPNGAEGEMFLGYKRYPIVINYLTSIIKKNDTSKERNFI